MLLLVYEPKASELADALGLVEHLLVATPPPSDRRRPAGPRHSRSTVGESLRGAAGPFDEQGGGVVLQVAVLVVQDGQVQPPQGFGGG
jgi:hypothetical protein